MNTLESFKLVNPQGDEADCAKLTIDDTATPFTLHDIASLNQEYVLTFWVKSDASGELAVCGEAIATTANWTQHSVTFTATKTNVEFLFKVNGIYYICQPKLEKGNKGTDWTPAPEDYVSSTEFKVYAEGTEVKITKAGKTAEDFMTYDADNGLQIGNKISGSWSGNRAQILPTAFNILDSSGTTLSSFGANEISLANNNANAHIYFCNKAADIHVKTIEDNDFFNIYSDNVSVSGKGNVYVESSADDSGETFATFRAVSNVGTGGRSASALLMAETPIGDGYCYSKITAAADSKSNPYMNFIVVDGSRGTEDKISIVPDKITLKSATVETTGVVSIANSNPYIDFKLAVGSASKGRIGIDANNYMKFTAAEQYSFDNVVKTSSDICVGGKGYNDGNDGVFMDADGYIQIQRNHASYHPYISFYLNGNSTATADGMIRVNQSSGYMQFMQADRYTFDARVDVTGAMYLTAGVIIGSGDSSSRAVRAITTYWNDNATHYLIERSADGLTAAFGWAGSSDYATVSKIRGRTCQVQNASGTSSLSDERLKKDFTKLDAWDAFYDALEPWAFRMKGGTSGRYHMGFKAQQVEQALLDAGLTTNDFAGFIKLKHMNDVDDPEGNAIYAEAGINEGDDEYGLIYTEFTALNTYQIQQLKKENAELKDEVAGLKKLVEQLLPI